MRKRLRNYWQYNKLEILGFVAAAIICVIVILLSDISTPEIYFRRLTGNVGK